MCICTRTFIIRSWLAWLWRLTVPRIGGRPAGDPEEARAWFSDEGRQAWDSSVAGRTKPESYSNGPWSGRILSYSREGPLFVLLGLRPVG